MRIFLSDSGTSEEGNFLPIKTIVPGTLKIVTINLKGISAEHGGRDTKKPNLKVSMVVTAKFLRKPCCRRSPGASLQEGATGDHCHPADSCA